MVKLFIGVTHSPNVDLLNSQLNYFVNQGYDVSLLAPDSEQVKTFCEKEKARHIPVDIENQIAPIKDLKTLFSLITILKKEKPDIVNLGTPKMSFLGMIAAYYVGIPARIYTCRGFRFEHEKGFFRKFLVLIEKIISSLSHRVFCISKSVADLGIQEGILTKNKVELIGKGSSNGIDLKKFNPDNVSPREREEIIKRYDLEDNFVFGYVGRLCDRKGINELYYAFERFYKSQKYNNIKLLVIGRPWWEQIKDHSIIEKFENHPGIILTGLQPPETIPTFLSIMNVFIFPAWWEGFGNVLLQAASMDLPILSTNTTGCKDAVRNEYNGILVSPYSVDPLVEKMKVLFEDIKLREKLSKNGREWVKNFEPKVVWKGHEKLYESLVE